MKRAPSGDIETIRVFASKERAPSQIQRDVVSVVKSKHESVSLSNVCVHSFAKEDWDELARTPRIRLEGVLFERRHIDAECRVTLKLNEHVFSATADGVASQTESLKMVAKATLAAVKECLPSCAQDFLLEGIGITQVAGNQIVVVLLTVLKHDGTVDYLSGSSPAGADQRHAVAKATLDALNRKAELSVCGTRAFFTK